MRPNPPVTHQAAILFLVLVPLIILRQFEKPRRRLTVWIFDLARLALGYASAELLLMILIIPYTNLVGKMGPRPPPDWRQRQEAMREAHTEGAGARETADPAAGPRLDGRRPHWIGQFQILHTTSLTLTTLEVFPGLFFLFGLYIILLHVLYRIKRYWQKTLRRPRLVHDSDRGWRIQRGNGDDGDGGAEHYFDDDPANMILSTKDRYSRARLGFVSGNYGHPVRPQWFFQQTACFALSAFTIKALILEICVRAPTEVDALRQFLFGWSVGLKRSHPTMAWFLVGILIPSVLYIIEFCVMDYALKYRSKPSKGSNMRSFVLPVYSLSDLEATRSRNRESRRRRNPHSTSYELTELRLPQVLEPEVIPPSVASPVVRAVTAVADHELEPPSIVTSLDVSPALSHTSSRAPTPSPRSSSIDSTSSDTPTVVSVPRGSGVCQLGLPKKPSPSPAMPAYGIVTASLLNTMAAEATASARPFLFSSRDDTVASSSSSSCADPAVSSSSEDENENEPHTAEGGDIALPSYDDSQRQQNELLRNNPTRAMHTEQVIREMKR